MMLAGRLLGATARSRAALDPIHRAARLAEASRAVQVTRRAPLAETGRQFEATHRVRSVEARPASAGPLPRGPLPEASPAAGLHLEASAAAGRAAAVRPVSLGVAVPPVAARFVAEDRLRPLHGCKPAPAARRCARRPAVRLGACEAAGCQAAAVEIVACGAAAGAVAAVDRAVAAAAAAGRRRVTRTSKPHDLWKDDSSSTIAHRWTRSESMTT